MREEARVMPIPELCNVCCSPDITFTTNDRIYGKLYGDWPKIWFCNSCRASVGCHKGTNVPLGRMANKKTRQLRIKVHEVFDAIWQRHFMSRKQAYNWLAEKLGIEFADCHISWLNDEQLLKAAEVAANYLNSDHATQARRQAKKDAKNLRRIKRDIEAVQRRKANGQPRFSRRHNRT